jgi:hypothetical protein
MAESFSEISGGVMISSKLSWNTYRVSGPWITPASCCWGKSSASAQLNWPALDERRFST